ncbi:MAG TPA: nucleotidyl transferase AbiEii/AbiGii toxin family protein [Clostridiales bacterium]|jgi:predicted nucleotidyltransferase component of viral defense system|nr:nucleotidyl transferase AbiEii/AbiGii toxin family protein [Lachnospiraceae bacterium]HBN83893.1 nucleotidyl transferase AbiEii/AbiGii toxin family protein [Clostridiales bacterium]HCS76165.1 nucleotidyl transferase AbiEii/AbiGii toxin family protein [Clostridiales bacterium]
MNALIRNMAKEKNINAQIILRNYMLERLLERISLSRYKENLILKGGMLIAAIVGLNSRSTMDMDTTLRNYPLTKETVQSVFSEILSIPVNDNVTLSLKKLEEIRDEAEYPGIRVTIEMFLDETKQTLKVDVTTGDFITPAAINYSFKLLFENRSITVKAYNLETVLAEKLETILSRSTANTRMRDFYDIYVLLQTQRQNIDASVLKEAFKNTIKIRGSEYLMQDTSGQILSELKDSKAMQDLWKRYQKRYDYAKNIPWKKAVKASENLCIAISGSGPISKQGD